MNKERATEDRSFMSELKEEHFQQNGKLTEMVYINGGRIRVDNLDYQWQIDLVDK